ncbi:DUF3887 domain-containing protein [Thermococcus sp.]
MKHALFLFTALLVLTFPIVSAQTAASGAFIKSMERGEYSYLKPYLTSQMQSAFPESKFTELRSSLIEKYGTIINASYSGSEGNAEYVRVNFERASVVFKLVIENQKIAGLWIVKVSQPHQEPGLTPQEAMMEAIVTGNYSLAEGYFSPLMKRVFTRALFEKTRNMIIRYNGEIRGYSFEKRAGTVYYYRLICEKRDIGVTVTVENGMITGFHMGLSFRLSAQAFYPFFGALLALLLLGAYLRKVKFAELLLGMVLFIVAIAVQTPLQNLPRLFGAGTLVSLVLWSGLMAAAVQESVKYYFSRNRSLKEALYVGAGFGFAEGLLTVGIVAAFGGSASPVSFLERFIVLFFHASTTLLFAHAYKEGWGIRAFGVMTLIHWIMDSLTAYWNIHPSAGLLATIYIITALTSAAVLLTLAGKAKNEVDEVKVLW